VHRAALEAAEARGELEALLGRWGITLGRDVMEVGHLLREAREAAGLTQAELARRAATHQSPISRIEQNAVSPTVRTLEGLLQHAGATLTLAAIYNVPATRRRKK